MICFCKNQYFQVNDKRFVNSKTIKNLKNDCSDGIIDIPDEFYIVLANMRRRDPIKFKIKLLEFLDFLDSDEKYIRETAFEIGEYIEANLIDISYTCQNMLLKYYPIINYYGKYGNLKIEDPCLPKYITPYYHENVGNFDIKIYCEYGNIQMLKYLSKGLRKQSKDSLISIASKHGHLDIIKYIVSIGGDSNKYSTKSIKLASEGGFLEVIKYLVLKGADFEPSSNEAIKIASKKGNFDVVKYLLSIGYSLDDAFIWTCAYEGDAINMVKYLMSLNPDIVKCNDKAVKNACVNGNLKILQYLLSNGMTLPVTICDIFMETSKNGHLSMLRCLVHAYPILDYTKHMALINASEMGHYDVVLYLISIGAPGRYRNSMAFMKAVKNNHLEIVKIFINMGIRRTRINYKNNALKIAVQNGYADMAHYLISNGAVLTP